MPQRPPHRTNRIAQILVKHDFLNCTVHCAMLEMNRVARLTYRAGGSRSTA
jgi:hypothetical protein